MARQVDERPWCLNEDKPALEFCMKQHDVSFGGQVRTAPPPAAPKVQTWICPQCRMECYSTAPMTLQERKNHHNRTVHGCEACAGRGWLLMNNDTHGLRIERCDSCEKFESDNVAVTAVVDLAERVLEASWLMNNKHWPGKVQK